MCEKGLSRQLLSLLVLLLSTTTSAERLPASTFAVPAKISDVHLSPGGKRLIFQQHHDSYSYVVTYDIDTEKKHFYARTDNSEYRVRWLRWVNDDHFLVSLYFPHHRYFAATGETRLLKGQAGKEGLDQVIHVRQNPRSRQHMSQFQDSIVSFLPLEPDHILVALDLDKPTMPSVYKINISEGGKRIVKRHRSPIRQWYADQQGHVRLGRGYDMTTGESSIWLRDTPTSSKWHQIKTDEPLDSMLVNILGFGLNPNELYINEVHEGRLAVFKLDLSSLPPARELILSDANYDVRGSLIYSEKTGDAVGITHSTSTTYWDDDYKRLQRAIDKALPSTRNQLLSLSADEMHYLLHTQQSDQPPIYHLGDRNKNTLSPLLYTYPQLDEIELARKQPITFQARDGLKLEGFVTRPVNASESGPAIVFPHGGPWSSTHPGFDPLVQMLAHRGYTIIEPDFRGSTGYGAEFMQEGLKNFGGTMQDDLEDAALWLVEQGWADAKRICIAGMSYGGYAALMGVAKTPERYQCAISFAGFSDPIQLRNDGRYYVSRKLRREIIGDDTAALKAASPRRRAKEITKPVLLLHGDEDRIVSVEHSREMAAALKKHNKVYRYLELEDGTHQLVREQNRIATYEAIDEFLREHLPVN